MKLEDNNVTPYQREILIHSIRKHIIYKVLSLWILVLGAILAIVVYNFYIFLTGLFLSFGIYMRGEAKKDAYEESMGLPKGTSYPGPK